MAADSFGLFVQQLSAADDTLKIKVAQIVLDLLMVHDIPVLVAKAMPVGDNSNSFLVSR
jgi:condensin complex subunit 3